MQSVKETKTATALVSNKSSEIISSVGNSVRDLLDRPNISMLKLVVDPLALETFLAGEIMRLTTLVNIDQRLSIQPEQIPAIAAQLIEMYPVESLEDFVLCFKRGATGFYGSIFRLDAAVLNDWMRKYLDEKYSLIEAEVAKTKLEEKKSSDVDYMTTIRLLEKRMQESKKDRSNADLNGYERYKLDNVRITTQEERAAIEHKKELHRLWIKENFDLQGHKLPGWVSEEDWLKKMDQR